MTTLAFQVFTIAASLFHISHRYVYVFYTKPKSLRTTRGFYFTFLPVPRSQARNMESIHSFAKHIYRVVSKDREWCSELGFYFLLLRSKKFSIVYTSFVDLIRFDFNYLLHPYSSFCYHFL